MKKKEEKAENREADVKIALNEKGRETRVSIYEFVA